MVRIAGLYRQREDGGEKNDREENEVIGLIPKPQSWRGRRERVCVPDSMISTHARLV